MASLSEGIEYARELKRLIREAREAGYYLHVDGNDLDLRDVESDDYIATVTTVDVD